MNLKQEDIFEGDFSQEESLVVVFGHIGFNEMSTSWRNFSFNIEELSQIQDPFRSIPNKPIKLNGGCWLWFVPEGENHGIATDQLEETLNNIFEWVKENTISSVTTNGVSNTNHSTNTILNRESDDERTRYLLKYIARIEKTINCVVTLTSRNDVFIRNQA